MLISDEYRFVFVHIQKTGGDTLSRMLKEQVPDLRAQGAKHERMSDNPALLVDYASYFKFAFVRNPWDRLVSWYSMISEAAQLTASEAQCSPRDRVRYEQVRSNRLWRHVLEEAPDFDSFIRKCAQPIAMPAGVSYSFSYNQSDYIANSAGELCADFVGRFESFPTDVSKVFNTLSIALDAAPYKENASTHTHYSKYYTAETQEIVRDRFQKDIALFGYCFESSDD